MVEGKQTEDSSRQDRGEPGWKSKQFSVDLLVLERVKFSLADQVKSLGVLSIRGLLMDRLVLLLGVP